MEKAPIQFIGEQLILGQIGNLGIALAFASALLAFFSYTFSVNNTFRGIVNWKFLGRAAIITHAVSIFTVIGIIFYILINHRFEYHYAWQHTSKSLPFKYVFAAFWEGQEGSFLLWNFWIVIISLILISRKGEWEGRVMVVFSIVFMFISSMVLGTVIDIPGFIEYKIGSNPFTLTRLHPNFAGAPFTKLPNYLQSLDGRGLNPALQNYWMTIHPPTLFFGFALTLVPYAFAVAGLWAGKLKEWMQPAIPWTFTGIAVLGGGVLMGGAWAYEALNFGGFWNWDPVENSSLVPWLTLVGAGHLMIIPKNKGTNMLFAIVLALFSFVLVLYSTFLTRSGVLGDASVHSFTDLGMSGQLLVYLFCFIFLPVVLALKKAWYRVNLVVILGAVLFMAWYLDIILYVLLFSVLFALLSAYLLARAYTSLFPKKDEGIYSREFWMFVGGLILLGSALHLTYETSKPVINKIFDTKYAPTEIDRYNEVQGVVAVLITFFIAVTQFLRYRQEKLGDFIKKILRSLIASVVLVLVAVIAFDEFKKPMYIILVLTSSFAVLANIDYIIQVVKGKWKLWGPSIAHIGFAMVILGAVVSAGHKTIISENNNGINLEMLNQDFKNNENIMLHKFDTVQMGPYYLNYYRDTMQGGIAYYHINYFTKDAGGQLKKEFSLDPKLILNDRMGNVAEPSTKHFLEKDVFTHVTYVDLNGVEGRADPSKKAAHAEEEIQHFEIEKGDTIFGTSYYITFEGLEMMQQGDNHVQDDPNNLTITLRGKFIARDFKGTADTLYPIYDVKDNRLKTEKDQSALFGIEVEVEKILENKKVKVAMREISDKEKKEFIIMKAIIFPGINILWAGCFLMVFGTLLAVVKRIFF